MALTRAFWRWLILGCGVALSAVLLAIGMMSQPVASTPPSPAHPVVQQPIAPPSPEEATPQTTIVPRRAVEPQTLTIASLGFDRTPLAQMTAGPPGSVLNPPTYDNPADYWRNFAPTWVVNLGTPGGADTNKTHIIAHACSADCEDPSWQRFNHLGDLKVGEVVTLGTSGGDLRYQVTGNMHYDATRKQSNADVRRLWQQEPGKSDELQLMSCSESVPGSGTFDQRTIVFAALIP